MLAPEILANSTGQFFSRHLSIRLDNGSLPMYPMRLNWIQPRALDRQSLSKYSHPSFSLHSLVCCLIQLRTFWLLCHVALSQISINTRLPSSANFPQTHSRKSVVTWLTGRPSTNRNNRLSVSRRNSP